MLVDSYGKGMLHLAVPRTSAAEPGLAASAQALQSAINKQGCSVWDCGPGIFMILYCPLVGLFCSIYSTSSNPWECVPACSRDWFSWEGSGEKEVSVNLPDSMIAGNRYCSESVGESDVEGPSCQRHSRISRQASKTPKVVETAGHMSTRGKKLWPILDTLQKCMFG